MLREQELGQTQNGVPDSKPCASRDCSGGKWREFLFPSTGCCSLLQCFSVRSPCERSQVASESWSHPRGSAGGNPTAPQPHWQVPVHGELGHKGDISGVGECQELVLQEEEVDAVLREVLPAEIVAGIVLVQLLQRLLQLQHRKGEAEQETQGVQGQLLGVSASLTWLLGGLGRLAQPKSSLRSRFPSYSRKVR